MKQIIITVFIVILLGSLMVTRAAENDTIPTTYKTYVTDGLGFYKVRNLETIPRQFTYEDRTLNINLGDTVIWENDADTAAITVISEQRLWDDKVGQIRVGGKINYRFDDIGKFTFYVKGTSMRQTIIVNSVVGGIDKNNIVGNDNDNDTGINLGKGEDEILPDVTAVTTITERNIPSRMTVKYTTNPYENVRDDDINDTSLYYGNISAYVQNLIYENLPIKITKVTVASVIVAFLSIYIAFRSGNSGNAGKRK